MKKQDIDQFGFYPSERYALDFTYIRRTAVASNRDSFWSIRLFPTEEQWEKINEIFKEGQSTKVAERTASP